VAFVLYAITAAAILFLAHRFVRRLSLAAAIVIAVIPLGIVGYALVTDSVYGPIDYPYQAEPLKALKPLYGIGHAHNVTATDIYAQFIPWRRAVQLSYQHGEWPLWNPYNHCGHLMAASLQSAPYSPFTLLAILLPAPVSMTFTAAMSLFIAALGAFLLARELDCGEGAALIAGAGWALAAITVLYSLTAMGFATSFSPLLLLGGRRVVREPGLASGALLATVLTLSLLIGHPESLFLNVVVAAAFAIFELIRRRAAPWRALATAFGAGAIALLLCAIQLLPFFEAMPQSGEYEFKEVIWAASERALPANRALASLATDLFPFLHVRRWVEPAFGLTGAETATAGSIILALAIYAVWRRRSPETWFFAGVAIFCTAAGNRWPLVVEFLQSLPLFDIVHHERINFQAALALAILAALGVEHMLRNKDYRAAAITMTSVLTVLAIGTWWLERNVVLAFDPADWGYYKVFAELFFLGLAALRPRLRIILPLIVAQRVMSEGGTFKSFPAGAAYPRIEILEPLKQIREPFRVTGASFALPPTTNIYYGLEDPRGFEALTLGGFVHTWKLWCQHQPVWFNRVDDLTRPFLSFLNVRYAITADTMAVPDGWKRVAVQRGAALIENTRAIERIFIPRRVWVGDETPQQIADRMLTATDFRELAWITDRGATTHERDNGPGVIALKQRRLAGEYLFDATMQRDGWVVISDSAWSGWRAYVGGRRVRMQRANAAFLAVYVPAGKHEVRVVYWPDSFVRGRAISAATLIAIALFGIMLRTRK
jgi:Bacterial membrane protein YfhO